MLAVASLIREAKSSIVLIDAYVGERTLDLLTMRDPGVTVQVLTSDESIKPAFVAHGKAFVRSAALWKFAQARRFTYRFIIIDDAACALKTAFVADWNKAAVVTL